MSDVKQCPCRGSNEMCGCQNGPHPVRQDPEAEIKALRARLAEVTEERNVQNDLRQTAEDAADALAEAMIRIEDLTQHDMGMCAAEERVIHFEAQSALLIYRAAREAIARGTPPAPEDRHHD